MENKKDNEYMNVIIRHNNNTEDEDFKKSSEESIATWIEMILNKYGSSIHNKEIV